ncbi:MAG: efflux RND transporter periplasmic adaptor subunit [Archangium sp.]|nr:efflux RND transporter periplasmic adaptor subunit [Archangium sp.]MDP3152227.1 efflux RND transporter periplasmic adaptor subunit [Archangium sp.]MDP3571072.1 efflux RND transporter periplasmic adaptor subunit [Archangium sp.]
MKTLLLLCLSFVACTPSPTPERAPAISADARGVTLSPDAPQWKYVELSVAAASPALAPLPVPGHVELDPQRTAAVGVPLPGRVESVLVRLGARVKQGDRLFSVRSGAFAELDRETEAARAQVAVRQRLLDRAKDLFELKAAAQKDVYAAEAELKEVQLTLKAAESKQRSLAVAGDGDNLFWVRAARSGTVVELALSPGQEVAPDREKPLLRVSDLDEVLVIADVPEGDVRDVSRGELVTIRPQTGSEERQGVVDFISEVVEPRRRTVEVWVRAKNTDRLLRPNGFVEVVIQPDAAAPKVRVPDAAVVTQGTRSVIFVSLHPGRLEPRAVQLGRRRDGETEIRAGLEVGTRFVSRGALLLLNQVDLSSDT